MISEFGWIDRALKPLTQENPGTFGLENDGAVISCRKGQDIVVTTDTLIQGSHFLPGEPPGDIARKALRVNLSDLASMGAKPFCYTLNLALSQNQNINFLDKFSGGLNLDQDAFDLYLLGGDTTKGPGVLSVSMTLFGATKTGSGWGRSGAKQGDYCFVTGSIGEGLVGLMIANGELECPDPHLNQELLNRHRLPQPRVACCRLADKNLVQAAIDISDGLLADIGHICRHSNVRIDLPEDKIPIRKEVRKLAREKGISLADLAKGGDDYELVLVVAQDRLQEFLKMTEEFGFAFTNLGQFLPPSSGDEKPVRLLNDKGDDITPHVQGWTHF